MENRRNWIIVLVVIVFIAAAIIGFINGKGAKNRHQQQARSSSSSSKAMVLQSSPEDWLNIAKPSYSGQQTTNRRIFGTLSAVAGECLVQRPGDKEYQTLKTNQPLYYGDKIKISQGSEALITPSTGGTVTFYKNTDAELSGFSAPGTRVPLVSLTAGKIQYKGPQNKAPLLLQTESASAAMRGGEVTAEHKSETTTIAVYEGSLLVKGAGQKVKILENHATIVKKGLPPEPPFSLPEPPKNVKVNSF